MARSPFPGMDPYLESPDLWPDVHETLVAIFREQLNPLLVPNYIAELNTRVVIDRLEDPPDQVQAVIPDVTIAQSGSAVREAPGEYAVAPSPLRLKVPVEIPTKLVSVYIRRREDLRLVAVIELLSPVNKRPGEGRQQYLEKRASYLKSGAHLIEIDLLCKWPRMPLEGELPASDYLIMVSNAYESPDCLVWPINLQQRLPDLSIPLLRPDPPVTLDINQALQTAYDRARYDLRVDYSKPPTLPLSEADVAWAVQRTLKT